MTKNHSVLIIEDEIVLQDVYKLVLSLQGYQVYTANNGAIGLHMLEQHSPDIILLDVFMPVMDGIEFLKSINLNDYPKLKIIMYTNLTDSETERQSLQLGASRYVQKSSMRPQDLVEMVAEYLAQIDAMVDNDSNS